MLRTVASPGTYGCHDRRFFCKCTEVTDNSCAPSAWCKYQGSAELRSWTTTEFSHSAGGPQLELRWGPGRAKRARARLTNFRPPLRPEKPDRKINSAKERKKSAGNKFPSRICTWELGCILYLNFFLPAAPFFLFCSAKRVR